MKNLYRIVSQISYGLGTLSLVLAFLFRFASPLGLGPYARGALICAGVLFLWALTSCAMIRSEER